MPIREMTEGESRSTIPQVALCRLACTHAGQPYVVPVFLAPHQSDLYGFSLAGRKIECMRANPLVCVDIDDVKSASEWTTLIVFGTYEELPDTREYEATRRLAHGLLQKRAMWWEPASVEVTNTKQTKMHLPIFYRIRINQITGHRAALDPTSASATPSAQLGFLKRVLRRTRST